MREHDRKRLLSVSWNQRAGDDGNAAGAVLSSNTSNLNLNHHLNLQIAKMLILILLGCMTNHSDHAITVTQDNMMSMIIDYLMI